MGRLAVFTVSLVRADRGDACGGTDHTRHDGAGANRVFGYGPFSSCAPKRSSGLIELAHGTCSSRAQARASQSGLQVAKAIQMVGTDEPRP